MNIQENFRKNSSADPSEGRYKSCDVHKRTAALLSDIPYQNKTWPLLDHSRFRKKEVDFCPALTFLLFFSPEIHRKVSTTQQHKREHDTVISCGEEAVSQLPATFKPGKSLWI